MTENNKYYCPVMGAWLPRRKSYRETIVQDEALCRAIKQHEAFKQKVSDAVEEYKADQPYIWKQSASDYFCRLIIPKPKPDPLVKILDMARVDPKVASTQEYVDAIRAGLDARGLEIRSKNDG